MDYTLKDIKKLLYKTNTYSELTRYIDSKTQLENFLKEFDYVKYINESEGITNSKSHLEDDTLGINYIYTDDNNDKYMVTIVTYKDNIVALTYIKSKYETKELIIGYRIIDNKDKDCIDLMERLTRGLTLIAKTPVESYRNISEKYTNKN